MSFKGNKNRIYILNFALIVFAVFARIAQISGMVLIIDIMLLISLPILDIRKAVDRRGKIVLYLNCLFAFFLWCFIYVSDPVFSRFLIMILAASYYSVGRLRKESASYDITANMCTFMVMLFMRTAPETNLVLVYIIHFSFFYLIVKGLDYVLPKFVAYPATLIPVLFLKIVNYYFFKYRFSYLGINDFLQLPTFLTIADNYCFTINEYTVVLLIVSVITLLLLFLLQKKNGIKERTRRKGIAFMAESIIPFVILGVHGNYTSRSMGQIVYQSEAEAFSQSVIDTLMFKLAWVDVDKEKAKLSGIESDEDTEVKPNIIVVLGESIADTMSTYDVSYSEDPFTVFRDIAPSDSVKGELKVNVLGGGTAISEWEIMTGLSVESIGGAISPFSFLKTDHSFTSDPLYDGYKKVLVHPGYKTGYNRDKVYDIFGFNERYFVDDIPLKRDMFGNYRRDADTYDFAKKILSDSKEPVFMSLVTIECHGMYEYDIPADMRIEELHGYADASVYASVEKDALNALSGFVEYLKAHPEEPTLLVFYGDHNPAISGEMKEPYVTPYLVYSNFSELSDMPESLSMGKLLPYSFKAAGLPLSKWEKYVIESGDIPDEKMTMARIKKGDF